MEIELKESKKVSLGAIKSGGTFFFDSESSYPSGIWMKTSGITIETQARTCYWVVRLSDGDQISVGSDAKVTPINGKFVEE